MAKIRITFVNKYNLNMKKKMLQIDFVYIL